MKKIFAIVLAVVAFAYSHVTYSQTITPAYDLFMANVTGWSAGTVSFSTTGAPLVSTGAPVFAPIAAAGGGGATVTTAAEVAVGASKAAVGVKGVITGASVFAAVKGLLGGPWGLALTAGVMVAPSLIDWLKAGGVRPAPVGSAKPFQIGESSVCSVSPCLSYSIRTYVNDVAAVVTGGSPQAVCSAASMSYPHGGAGVVTGGGTFCELYWAAGDYGGGFRLGLGITSSTVDPVAVPWQLATIEEIRAKMESMPAGAPLINDILGAGWKLDTRPTDIWGPATVSNPDIKFNTVILPLPSTTTDVTEGGNTVYIGNGRIGNGYRDVHVNGGAAGLGTVVSIPTNTTTSSVYNPATNTTTTTTTKNYPGATVEQTTKSTTDLTYDNSVPKVTAGTTKTVETVVKNPDGSVVSRDTTTDSTSPVDKPKEELGSISDTAFGDIPVLYERKYPDGIKGVWTEKMTALKASPLFALGKTIMPSLPAGGSCPSFRIPVDMSRFGDFGTADVSPPCFIWDFAKVVIVVSSLLLARRLIFGG